ncbi:MAG TPA: GYF domain-containing protein [Polyangiaceae bacterium]|nr:GYF domain-containing protein [Polyangiaceae bacterium]
MTHDESAHEDSEDRFYAQFDSREVELMTLDELAAAFEAGQIHANTFVCREGESEWLTLAEVAGLGEEDEAEAEAEPAPVVERRPPMPERRPEMPVAASVASQSRPPMPERRPEMPQRRPEMATEPAARFHAQSIAPVAPSLPTPSHSFAPVTSNVDYSNLDSGLDFDELAMRPKRRWGLVLAAAAVLALAGGGTVFALNGGGSALASAVPDKAALDAAASHSQASLTLANIQTKPSEPVPAAPSTPEPVAAAAPAAPATEASKPGQLSEDMKQALLASDKTRDSKKAKKAKGRAATAAPRRGGGGKVASSGGGFKSGGSAYDPLNGKL